MRKDIFCGILLLRCIQLLKFSFVVEQHKRKSRLCNYTCELYYSIWNRAQYNACIWLFFPQSILCRAAYEGTQSLTFIPEGRSDFSGLTGLYHTVKNVEDRQTPNNKGCGDHLNCGASTPPVFVCVFIHKKWKYENRGQVWSNWSFYKETARSFNHIILNCC